MPIHPARRKNPLYMLLALGGTLCVVALLAVIIWNRTVSFPLQLTGQSVGTSGPIFSESFESGALRNVSPVYGKVSVVKTAAYQGNYAMRAVMDGKTNANYVTKKLPSDVSELTADFRFKFPTTATGKPGISFPQGESVRLAVLQQNANHLNTVQVYLRRYVSEYYLYLRTLDKSGASTRVVYLPGNLGTSPGPATAVNVTHLLRDNSWHRLELYYKAGTTGSNGITRMKLDGITVGERTNGNTGGIGIGTIQLGPQNANNGENGSILFDQFALYTYDTDAAARGIVAQAEPNYPLIYQSYVDGNQEVYKRNPDGSTVNLTNNPGQVDREPRLNYNSDTIVYYSSYGVPPGGPGLYTMDINGNNKAKLPITYGSGGELANQGAISVGKTKLAYRNTGSTTMLMVKDMYVGGGLSSDTDVWRSNNDGVTFDTQYSAPSWDITGRYLLFNGSRSGGATFYNNIYIADMQEVFPPYTYQVGHIIKGIGGNQDNNKNGSFSPNGNLVVYNSSRSGSEDLYLFNRLSGATVQLTSAAGDELFPSFGADNVTVFYWKSGAIHMVKLNPSNYQVISGSDTVVIANTGATDSTTQYFVSPVVSVQMVVTPTPIPATPIPSGVPSPVPTTGPVQSTPSPLSYNVYLPVVHNVTTSMIPANSGTWSSEHITLQNLGYGTATVRLDLHQNNSAPMKTIVRSIPPNSSSTVSTAEFPGSSMFSGVIISNQPVAAGVINVNKISQLGDSYQGFNVPASKQTIPLVFRGHANFKTIFYVQNALSTSQTVTIRTIRNGSIVSSPAAGVSRTIPGNSMVAVNFMSDEFSSFGSGDGAFGFAIIEGQGNVAAVAENIYDKAGSYQSSYAIGLNDTAAGTTLMAPLIYNNHANFNSGINLVNLTGTASTVTFTYNADGAVFPAVGTRKVDLPIAGNGLLNINLATLRQQGLIPQSFGTGSFTTNPPVTMVGIVNTNKTVGGAYNFASPVVNPGLASSVMAAPVALQITGSYNTGINILSVGGATSVVTKWVEANTGAAYEITAPVINGGANFNAAALRSSGKLPARNFNGSVFVTMIGGKGIMIANNDNSTAGLSAQMLGVAY